MLNKCIAHQFFSCINFSSSIVKRKRICSKNNVQFFFFWDCGQEGKWNLWWPKNLQVFWNILMLTKQFHHFHFERYLVSLCFVVFVMRFKNNNLAWYDRHVVAIMKMWEKNILNIQVITNLIISTLKTSLLLSSWRISIFVCLFIYYVLHNYLHHTFMSRNE